ncbi:hypothetical protein FRC07_014949 [Ceratobasidium sp. 392]|nr:hypothetical protein FRC07_014949 [Ceratobasidium sp. 392]
MFLPTVRSVRKGMLAQVLELQSVLQPGDNELEITDPSALTGDNEDAFYELLELEDSHKNYSSAQFKPGAVTFVSSELLVLSVNDRHSILSALSPGNPETQHVLYRLCGLQSILPQIQSIECSHPGLLAQRDNLITVINIEINQMLSELWREREIQTSVSATLSAHSIRKVDAECSTLYPLGGNEVPPTPAICEAQNIKGTTCGATLSKTHHRGAQLWHRPISQYSHMQFETWATELLQRPGAEDLLESGRPNPHPRTIATDVWDAPYMRDFLKSADPTFMNPPAGDLLLIMMLHFDFFNPCTNKTSRKVRSVGCFFMVCLNLPPDVRYNVSNAYLVSMVPGPKEVKAEHLHVFVKPIVDNMLEMFSPGIWVSQTHKYPRGRRVCAAIAIKSMDIPAARGSGGFALHGHTCCCHLCNAKRNAIDRPSLLLFQPRTVEARRQIVDLWVNALSLAERQRVFDTYGV